MTADEAYGQVKYLRRVWLGEAGLDKYQVRDYRAWYAHTTLSMPAAAWLPGTRAAVAPQTASANTTPSSKA
ncbi:hypothetical protein ACFWMG_42760 [Streptomyces sp. NPDC127074]|uniref:hypothetical protein n=1 Tax=Streptomyces sp. NPDC127074 TaxID=3347130 RepID=UPI00365C1175